MHVALAQQSLFGEQVQLPDGPFDRRLGCRHGAQPQRLLRFVRQVGQFLAQQRGRQQTPGRLRLQAGEQPVQAASAPVGFASGPASRSSNASRACRNWPMAMAGRSALT
ncbi:hypothetical protein ACP3P8_27220 [Pseudomonas aeruginosa]